MSGPAPLLRLVAAASLVLAAPQLAAAQTLASTQALPAAATRLDLSRLSSPYDAAQALKAAGVAHTSIDRRLQDKAATASVGFLCGVQPTPQVYGAAGALGVDHDGRFLGAQLRLGFR